MKIKYKYYTIQMTQICPVKYLPGFLNGKECSTKILIYLFLFFLITILIHFTVIYEKFSYDQKFYYLIIIHLFLLYLAYLNEEYTVMLLMILTPIPILICASTHEYLYKNFPNKFKRLASFEKKEDFMFLPKWALIFYSNFVYIGVFMYKVIKLIV
jgi:hypothetical protein